MLHSLAYVWCTHLYSRTNACTQNARTLNFIHGIDISLSLSLSVRACMFLVQREFFMFDCSASIANYLANQNKKREKTKNKNRSTCRTIKDGIVWVIDNNAKWSSFQAFYNRNDKSFSLESANEISQFMFDFVVVVGVFLFVYVYICLKFCWKSIRKWMEWHSWWVM